MFYIYLFRQNNFIISCIVFFPGCDSWSLGLSTAICDILGASFCELFGISPETVPNCVIAPALPELLWLPTVWRCPYIEIAFSTLDCSIVPTCGAWCSATAAKRGPLKQSWAGIQHSRDGEPLGVLMQMQNARVNGFFFFSSLGVLPGVLVDTLSLCSGNFCVECVLIELHKFYIERWKKFNWLDHGPSMRFDEIIIVFCNKCM